MDLLLAFALIGIWIYVLALIGTGIVSWKERRDYHKSLHPKKRRHWPFKARRKRVEPERRILYRPPNKDE